MGNKVDENQSALLEKFDQAYRIKEGGLRMRVNEIAVLLSLAILTTPSIGAAQWPSAGPTSYVQVSIPNPMFPEHVGIPWLAVPQLGPYLPPPTGSNAFPAPSIASSTKRPQFLSPSLLNPEIVYVGKTPVILPPLPLPLNPIAARLQSFGFFLQVPMIPSPIEDERNR